MDGASGVENARALEQGVCVGLRFPPRFGRRSAPPTPSTGSTLLLVPIQEPRTGQNSCRSTARVVDAKQPSASAYGNPLRGTRDDAPVVPIGAPLVARTDVPDAHGWRVYRVAPNGAVIYDGWIEHDPANAELALTELHAAAAASPAAALRRAVERQPDHASAEAITCPAGWPCPTSRCGSPITRARKRSRGGSPARRPGGGAPRRSPGRGRHAGGGGAPSRGAALEAPHREPRRPAVDADRCPWLQRAGPPDDDHAGRRAAWCGTDVVHAADDTAVATILTTAHDIHRISVAFNAGRISTSHATAAAARASLAVPLHTERPRDRGPRGPVPPRVDPLRAPPPTSPRGAPSTRRPPPPTRPHAGTPPGHSAHPAGDPVRRTALKRGEPCPNEPFSGSAPRSSSAPSTTPAAPCGR